MKNTVTCFAWGHEGIWEALCVDFDLTAHGQSLEEVKCEIQDAIETYVSYVYELPESERSGLLNRKAPRALRWKLELYYRFARLLNFLRIRFANFYSFQPAVVLAPTA